MRIAAMVAVLLGACAGGDEEPLTAALLAEMTVADACGLAAETRMLRSEECGEFTSARSAVVQNWTTRCVLRSGGQPDALATMDVAACEDAYAARTCPHVIDPTPLECRPKLL
jgi:hypothetical protein